MISRLQILEFRKGEEEGKEKSYAVISVLNSHAALNIKRESSLTSAKRSAVGT